MHLLTRFICVSFSQLLLLQGCGYSFRNSGTVLPPTVKKIYIPYVENRSTEATLSQLVTESIRDEFERYGVVQVVESRDEADATLKVAVLDLKRKSKTVAGRSNTDNQRQSTLSLGAELKTSEGKILWQQAPILVGGGFGTDRSTVITSGASFVGGTLGASDVAALGERELQRGQEQEILSQLADQAAAEIYEAAVAEPF